MKIILLPSSVCWSNFRESNKYLAAFINRDTYHFPT